MTIKEATREELKKLKGKPLKEKVQHILTYYWVPIVAVLIVAFIAGTLIDSAVNQKDCLLYGYCINASENLDNANSLVADFSAHAGLTAKQEILLLPNLSTNELHINDTMQALTVHVAAQNVDFLASDAETCCTMIQYGYFSDLTEIFSSEQLEKLTPYLLYAERSDLAQEQTNATEMPPLPSLGNKADMQDPVAVAIRIGADTPFTKAYGFKEKEAVMLVMPNTQRVAMLCSFLDYILD